MQSRSGVKQTYLQHRRESDLDGLNRTDVSSAHCGGSFGSDEAGA